MTKRSMPPSFHANLFALVTARCRCQDIGGSVIVKGLVHWGQVALHQLGADKPDPFAPIYSATVCLGLRLKTSLSTTACSDMRRTVS